MGNAPKAGEDTEDMRGAKRYAHATLERRCSLADASSRGSTARTSPEISALPRARDEKNPPPPPDSRFYPLPPFPRLRATEPAPDEAPAATSPKVDSNASVDSDVHAAVVAEVSLHIPLGTTRASRASRFSLSSRVTLSSVATFSPNPTLTHLALFSAFAA